MEISMIFDTHAHYDDEAFDEDREALLNSMKEGGVGRIVNIGANMETSRRTVELTGQYDFMYGAVGVHPSDTGDMTQDDIETLRRWSGEPKILAIGEIGLDYHYPEPSRETQKNWFIRQLMLAREENLPVVIHSRDAAADTLEILKEYGRGLGGVIHCFSYTKEMAAEYVKLGYYIGIGGVVTFKNARKLAEAVEVIPLERLVLETDCPYLSPEPYRGTRNSSLNLTYVAQTLAQLKGVSYDEIIKQTEQNAQEMYRI